MVGAGRDQPDRGRRRRGSLLLGLRRQALPRLRLAARQRQHRAPAPEDRRGDQGAGRQAVHDRAADGDRSRVRASAGCSRRSRRATSACRSSRTAAPRRTRTRSSSRGSYTGRHKIVARYRSYHGATARLRPADRRPAPLARRAGHGRCRPDVRPVHVPLPRRPSGSVPGLHGRAAPRGDPRVRGRAHRRGRDPRDGDRDERDHPAAATATCRRSARSATGTGSCSSSTR